MRPVEHPRRNFQPTVCLRTVQGAAKNDMVSLVDSPTNANSAIKPRMMPIQDYRFEVLSKTIKVQWMQQLQQPIPV